MINQCDSASHAAKALMMLMIKCSVAVGIAASALLTAAWASA